MKTYATFSEYCSTVMTAAASIDEKEITAVRKLVQSAAKKKKTVFIIGNGGSAAAASHMATDFAKGVFHRSKLHVKVVSLTDNVSYITAIGNDIGYDDIFSEQLRCLGGKGDLLICISASGNSPNLVKAVNLAKKMKITTIAMVGFDGGKLKKMCDLTLHATTDKGAYGPSEDIHVMLLHYLVEKLVELS